MKGEDRAQILRLRLAAKALLEWRTPRTSEHYQNILGELISKNAIARSRGWKQDNPIMQLDEQGSAMWYLSDTLMLEAPENLEPISEGDVVKILTSRALEMFETAPNIERFANP